MIHIYYKQSPNPRAMVAKTGTIRQRILILSVAPEEVYNALIDPKKHSAFTGPEPLATPSLAESLPPGTTTSQART